MMLTSRPVRTIVGTVVLAVTAGLGPAYATAASTTAGSVSAATAPGSAPTVRSAVAHDTSPTLRRLARRTADERAAQREAEQGKTGDPEPTARYVLPKAEAAKAPAAGEAGSAARQLAAPQPVMPEFGADFEGVPNLDEVYPPDTVGDVGGDYFVQMVNLSFQIFDKNTGESLLGPLPNNALWDGLGGACENQNDGDPIVLYDHLSDRWMLSQFALFAADGNHQCIAVSQTGDPTGAYHRYDFLISETKINDYPHFGVWPDAYYMSINQFDNDSFEYAGAGAVAFERDQMLQGLPAQMVYFDLFEVNPLFGGQLPADLDGAAPPDGAPGLFLEADDDAFGFESDRIHGWEFSVDWDDPDASTYGDDGEPTFFLETEPFDANMCGFDRSCIPQPDTSVGLDAISDRILHRVQYRNFGDRQTMVVNHTVDENGEDHAGVRWYELRSADGGGTWDIHQQGTYAPDEDHRWMASAAMDVVGNIAIGYSVASETTYPSIRVAGRLADDPLGQLAQGEAELIAGTGSQTGEGSRWGDYSAMVVDPADECTFYYTTEYVEETGPVSWQTRVGSFKFPNCAAGPSGTVTGTVTDAETGDPLAGATVTVGSSSTATGDDGTYSIRMPVGTYDVTASAFGYESETVAGVVVEEDATVTLDFALEAKPLVTVRGRVVDGSGHGWPLYAKLTVRGTPLDPVYTFPRTGLYSVQLPADETYTFEVEAQYPGYQTVTADVVVGAADRRRRFALPVDAVSCVAPGYTINLDGIEETFDEPEVPEGWDVVDNLDNGQVWVFDDPAERGNLTGGEGGFAIVDSDAYGDEGSQDTELVSPSVDMTGIESPVVSFAQDYLALGDIADVDVSIDGGDTWETVLSQTSSARGPRTTIVPLPMAADESDVRVRFHYYEAVFAWWWEVDDVFIGNRTCDPVPGGLVIGQTRDVNVQAPVNGVKVASVERPEEFGVSAPTPEDDQLADGFYWLFSSLTGNHPFEASKRGYVSQTQTVNVLADDVVRANFRLTAGQVTVDPTEVDETVELGDQTSGSVTYTNEGSAPATVTLTEQNGGFVILRPDGSTLTQEELLAMPGAPAKRVRGTFSPTFDRKGGSPPVRRKYRAVAAEPWADIADYPTEIMDNAMAYGDGLVYSVGGFNGNENTEAGYVYDPAELTWSPIADLPAALEKPNAAFLDGRMFVFGGWTDDGTPSTATYIYDPESDSWSEGGEVVEGYAASGVATSGGQIYAWGGCDAGECGAVDGQVYDPATDTWSSVADYPEPTSWQACGDVSGTIYCAGGTGGETTSTATYAYDAGSDSWAQVADMPIDLWGMAYTGANGLLLVSTGVTDGFNELTNVGFAYDPTADSWSEIPNANEALYRSGSTCGFYRAGGSTGGFSPDSSAAVLPGFDQCGTPADVPWLSTDPTSFTLTPGESVEVTIGLDASQVTQPGTYTGRVRAGTDTPYPVTPVEVTMRVTPPPSWGKLLGIVEARSCAAVITPLPGATVQLNGVGYAQTLLTDAEGGYAVWLDAGIANLRLIVAKDGYVPQTRLTDVRPGDETVEDFLLRRARC